MSKKTKDSKKKKMKLSDLLTPQQQEAYKTFGEPDMSQNWLELFTEEVVSDLFTIMRSCSDNQKKSDYVTELMETFGFQDVGLGTNILTMSNPVYPGVVFKIALDDYGIADNFNDTVLQDIIPHYVPVFARHPSAIVSVQQRGVLATAYQMDLFKPRINALLKELTKRFLVADLSARSRLNYVVDRDGDFLICDGSDLYPLSQVTEPIRCKRITGSHEKTGKFKYCGGKLHYTDDFYELVCEKCGETFNPLDFRPRKDVSKMRNLLSDAIDAEERRKMAEEELELMMRRRNQVPTTTEEVVSMDREAPKTIFVDPEPVDTEDEEEEDEYDPEEDRIQKPSFEEPTIVSLDTLGDTPSDDSMNDGSEDESVPQIEHVAVDPNVSTAAVITDEGGEPEDVLGPESDRDPDGFTILVRRDKVDDAVRTAEPVLARNEMNGEITEDIAEVMVSRLINWKEEDPATFERYARIVAEIADRSAHRDESSEASSNESTELKETQSHQHLESPLSASDNEVDNHEDDPGDEVDDQIASARDLGQLTVDENLYQYLNRMFGEDRLRSIYGDSKSNETDNTIRHEEDLNTEPHVHYRVVNGSEDSMLPGIYLDITGDFDDAYDESGLSLYISFDKGATYTKAVRAVDLKKLIEPAVESALILASPDEDDPDEDDDSEIEISPATEFITHTFFESQGEDSSDEEEDEDDEL